MTANQLATLQRLGIATPEQTNQLAEATMRTARIAARVACQQRRLRHHDIDDVVQLVTIKAFRLVERWQLEKSAWQTWVSVIARSIIADQGRRYQKDLRLAQVAAVEEQLLQELSLLETKGRL